MAFLKKNGSREIDFRKSYKRLEKKDALFRLERPARPSWMARELYDHFTPDHLIVRAIKTKKRVIVTTLTDAETYSRADISQLYTGRWNIELDFRSIKTMMKMEVLRCKTPEMIRKEIYVHFLVYNLIRALMARTAKTTNEIPRKVSFQATKQVLLGAQTLLLLSAAQMLERLMAQILVIISEHRVGDRPGRSEPRAVKRRSKPFQKLQHSRPQARRLKKYRRTKG